MSEMLKVVVSLCFFFLLDNRAIRFGTCAQTLDADAFTIRHASTGQCLVAEGPAGVGLERCASTPTPSSPSSPTTAAPQVWKWGSGRRLFHVATARCLGLNVGTKAPGLFPCSSTGVQGVLQWRCLEGALLTAYEMGLAVSRSTVVAKHDASDAWTADEGPEKVCQRAYRVVHTSGGNSDGAPCDFPFLANGSWHHGCLSEADAPENFWCSTNSDYDQDHKFGRCLLPERGCGTLFKEADGGVCYQFVNSVAVSWPMALDSCRSQGAELLSLGGPEELSSPTFAAGLSGMPDKMWMGLHQLDTSQGWQWSDGRPLAFLRWGEGMPSATVLVESDCGVLTSRKDFQSESCSEHLPYVCRKMANASFTPSTSASLDYQVTVCPDGWMAWSGWCYRLEKDEPQGFVDAQTRCSGPEAGGGGTLASLHSLDAKEMISTHFHAEGLPLDVWIGLIGTGTNNTVFKWADQSPVSFTYWGPEQPTQPIQDPSCVFYSGESYGWRVGNCSDRLPYLCQKKGEISGSAPPLSCPADGGWKRHGNSCYQVNSTEVSFKDRCNISIRNGFEQAFVSRMLGEQLSLKTRYFWIGLQDTKSTGEYQWVGPNGGQNSVTYTNWGWTEPAGHGGCAVMSTAKPLGKWEVKNCTAFKAGTICRRDLVAPPPAPPLPDPSLPCPEGWQSRPNISYCYKVFHEERLSRKRSWEEAQRFCWALGADLPSFTKSEEMVALHSIMRDSISDNRFFWVGLNRRNPTDRSWTWSDGRPVSMGILHQDFHSDDAYSRDCTAFKTMKTSLKLLFESLFHDIDPWPFYATPFHCDAQLEWVCQIPRGVKPKVPEWYNPGGHHETSIFVDGGEYWFINDLQLSFEEASLFCSTSGSRLAAPMSFTAARKIHEHLPQNTTSPKQSWWVDMKQPGHYFPMTSVQMHFYHSLFLGRCTSLSKENLFPEYDHSCAHKLSFVCERHNVTSVERNPLEPYPGGFPCEKNSLAFRNKCFTIMKPSQQLGFQSANDVCKSLRGTLVTVADQVEQDFLTTLLPGVPELNQIWIGLKLRSTSRQWVDDTPAGFQNFNPLLHGMLRPIKLDPMRPMNLDIVELCVFMINHPSSELMGTWDYSNCGDKQHTALCQHYADKPEEPQAPTELRHFNNHTVQLLVGNMTWSEAAARCRSKAMVLVSVGDVSLQSWLTVLVSRARTPMWIGLFSEDSGVHFRWTDRSHTVFSRWSPEASSGSCVYHDTDGFWKATECEGTLGGAICHKRHEDAVIKSEDPAVKCPHTLNGPNWLPFRNNCYSFQLVASRWAHFDKGFPQDTCRDLYHNSNVLTIRNAEENEFVRQQLVPFKSLVQYVWLGLIKDNTDNQMKWYEGTNVQFNNWRNGRPQVEQEFMAGMNEDGIWDIITNKNYFSPFRQRSIVACKLDNEPREKYNLTSPSLRHYGSLSFTVLTRKLTWLQALEQCTLLGGHLASIHDNQHQMHVELIARTDGFPLWIGLSNQDSSNPVYEWSDGTNLDYQAPIKDSQKSPQKSQAGCVTISPSGMWMREDCKTLVEGALCYTTNTTTPSQRARLKSPALATNCPHTTSKWLEFQDHCYAFNMTIYNSSVYNMADATSVCVGLGGHLLTLTSMEENDFVASQVTEDPLITKRVWLGLNMDKQGVPVGWVDDSPLDFTNWGTPPPLVGAAADHPCVVLDAGDQGRWRRVSCSDSLSRVVCKTTKSSPGSPVALVMLLVILLALAGVIVFLVYKKKRAYFTSSVRYKRNFDEADSTSIITEAE
ncbi:lymphocyte antigen 75 [Gadus chalcogrammus]|uniref:lymphocyte antigen 75 n=1 Tax=Gadus chalcogrammus TaxID=1042646 RepID=UPI0024C4B387|nr:lymphocyte antigen 75 [Gadus chalcogrammus]